MCVCVCVCVSGGWGWGVGVGGDLWTGQGKLNNYPKHISATIINTKLTCMGTYLIFSFINAKHFFQMFSKLFLLIQLFSILKCCQMCIK